MRASDRQEIQHLKSSLEEMHKDGQVSRGQAIQQSELVKQLQAKGKRGYYSSDHFSRSSYVIN